MSDPSSTSIRYFLKNGIAHYCLKANQAETVVLCIYPSEEPGFALRFRLDGRYYWQSMNWHSRAARANYFGAMVKIYRYAVKNHLTDYSLAFLADSDKKYKRRFRIRSPSQIEQQSLHDRFTHEMEIERRYRKSLKCLLAEMLTSLEGNGWSCVTFDCGAWLFRPPHSEQSTMRYIQIQLHVTTIEVKIRNGLLPQFTFRSLSKLPYQMLGSIDVGKAKLISSGLFDSADAWIQVLQASEELKSTIDLQSGLKAA